MLKKKVCIILLTIIYILGMAMQAEAAYQPAIKDALPAGQGESYPVKPPGKDAGRVVMVVLDRFRVADLSGELPPNFKKITGGGAVALMNYNTAGGINPDSACVTIGGGAHLKGYETSGTGFEADTRLERGTAADEYFQRTGKNPPSGSLVQVGIASLKKMNETLPYTAEPGALGKAIHNAGLKTAFLGNSDTALKLQRQALSIAMDENGLVDFGLIGQEALTPDLGFVGGVRTDYSRLMDEYKRLPSGVAMTVIDLGDFSRLYYARNDVFNDRLEELRRDTIKRVDQFLGQLMERMDFERDLLLVVVPTPWQDLLETDRLTPVVAYGAGIKTGLLTSPTTRRAGVVLNIDLAPTVLNFLGLNTPLTINGRAMQVVPAGDTVRTLQDMSRQLALTYDARPYLQKGYIFYQLILLILSLMFIFWKIKVRDYLKPFLLSVMVVPLVYLVLPLFPQPGPLALATQLVVLTVLLTVLILILQRFGFDPFTFICLATAGSLLVDTLTGSTLQKTSVLGYDPIVGARFYGMGNEYMGILIGSLIIGISSLLTVFPKYKRIILPLAGAVFILAVYNLAAPQLGTNVGGTIASASAFLVTFLLLAGVKFNIKTLLMVASGVVLVVSLFILYDIRRPVELQSHMGRAASLIAAGGFDEIVKIIIRKSEMNIKLIKYANWSRIFIASLASLALLFYRPIGVVASIKVKYPYLYRGFMGVIVGSIVALIFNDSGVVAAATTMVFCAPPLIYMVLGEMETSEKEKEAA